jgi:hypothetical protein
VFMLTLDCCFQSCVDSDLLDIHCRSSMRWMHEIWRRLMCSATSSTIRFSCSLLGSL